VQNGPFYYGRSSGVEAKVKIFDLKKREFKTVTEAGNFALSADGKKLLIRKGGGFRLVDAKPEVKNSKTVSTDGMELDLVPADEWTAIFNEVWRRYRDFFYVENMHGYDWQALRKRYRPWLAHVKHRSDLNYVIGEMIGELNVGHAYISGGDYEIPDRPSVALPGAEFELDPSSGRYRIARILQGQNEEDEYRAPLTEIGVDARVGDYVLAIDGTELRAGMNPYRLLRHKASRPVELLLSDTPASAGARKVSYRPISDESNLRYLGWVAANRKAVADATDGTVGYLHVPDMSSSGISEFIKWYYPQLRKEGLIVDVRGNGGGNVSQMLIERLRRKLLGTRFSRTNDDFRTYPGEVFLGHLVCLVSENSASDGDIFAARFKQAGLGPLIGKRSWGGVIGITSHGPLMDGGDVRVPEFATNAVDGSWIIEGHGVDPDIVVANDPEAVIAGRDQQLERAIEEVQRRIREEPRPPPRRPEDPVRTL
jgi:tricorn protease